MDLRVLSRLFKVLLDRLADHDLPHVEDALLQRQGSSPGQHQAALVGLDQDGVDDRIELRRVPVVREDEDRHLPLGEAEAGDASRSEEMQD